MVEEKNIFLFFLFFEKYFLIFLYIFFQEAKSKLKLSGLEMNPSSEQQRELEMNPSKVIN